MIVKILSNGKSFKGLSDYLTHDPKAESATRVGFTHILNCANDHVPSAVNEMVWTARDAELLKQEAGIRAGGRATEKPVKHVSLNWAPGETPTREHMIASSEGFLQHMGWQEHQTVIVAHTDKHSHVHLMINGVNPTNGLRLNNGFERRRAQTWALEYELENNMIHCGQRLKRPGEREDAPTRDAWQAFQSQKERFERDENSRRENAEQSENIAADAINPKTIYAAEWQKLKELQRTEREQFFSDGKSVFLEIRNSVYRELRDEYRERWSQHYAGQRDGADHELLATHKAELLAEQKATLAARRDEACGALRETRDGFYRGLLDGQREARHDADSAAGGRRRERRVSARDRGPGRHRERRLSGGSLGGDPA